MKTFHPFALILALALALALPAFGQVASTPPASAAPPAAAPAATTPAATTAPAATVPAASVAPPPAPAEGRHYLVKSDLGPERSAKLLLRLESAYNVYSKVFRFYDSRLPAPLVVREFATKADFDAYLLQVAGETRGDFVYLHYPSPQKRELLLFPKAEPEYSASLAHQAFAQYLNAFIQQPPLWMRMGFSTFFETLRWTEAGEVASFDENLGWLETVKNLQAKNGLIPLDRLLSATPEEAKTAVEVLYPEAWAFVSFLMNDSTGDFTRLLWETLATLGPDAELAENQSLVLLRVTDWYGIKETEKAFQAYVTSRKTFPELIAEGIEVYGRKDYALASTAFGEANLLEPDSFVPPYYLGLIAYAKGDYSAADSSYRKAASLGCDGATISYAIGLNAIARGLVDEGATSLAGAAAAAPDRYKTKVEDLLKKLGK